jgi:c-di-GMP-binding flagellar brake protein YcgR
MIFKAIFGGSSGRIPATRLPAVHGFADVTVAGRPARSVSVEAVDDRTIVTREILGRPGEQAVFVYANDHGKYRFGTRILRAKDGETAFEAPKKVDVVGKAAGGGGAQKRASVRLDTIVPGQWRFAPGGKGMGDFVRANIRDISRGGCSLIVDRHIKGGTTLEVRLQLRSDRPVLVVLGEVMRTEPIAASGRFSLGLRFHGVTPEEDHAILDFINRKQAELRSRGLA